MSGTRRRGSRGAGHLSDDEHDLWSHTASSIEPLRRAKGRHVGALAELADVHPHPPRPVSADEPQRGHGARAAEPDAKPKLSPARKLPPLAEFDRKKERRIRRGQAEIEARLDLHGMTLTEAHGALRAFLHRAAGQGKRTVLVITGKGTPPRRDLEMSMADLMHGRERGVLRRHVPMWLAEPDLRAVVVSFTEAAQRHGGEGALYVHLRCA